MNIYRHGDLLIRQIEELPKGLKKAQDKTLAYGEVTGHSHRFEDLSTVEVFLVNGELKKYLQVNMPSPLIHEEHKRIIIEPGMYEIINEREYSYEDAALKKVVD